MFALFIAFFALLAGRVLAQSQTPFLILLNNVNVTASSTLGFDTSSPLLSACSANITAAQGAIAACQPLDAACFCSPATVTAFYDAELCMLHTLIAQNKRAPDALAGSNVVVGAYATACKNFNQTVPATQAALTLPDDWEGPYTAVLPVGTAIVFVIFAGIFGVSALLILCNIE